MNISQNLKILLISSLVFLGLIVCAAGFVLLGGVRWIGDWLSPSPAGLTVQVYAPQTVEKGKPYQVVVIAGNTSTASMTLEEIQIPQQLLDASLLIQVTPSDTVRRSYGSYTSFEFGTTLSPGDTRTFSFSLQGQQSGDYKGNITVVVDSGKKAESIRISVSDDTIAVQNSPSESSSTSAIPFEAVVLITAYYNENGQLVEGWTGSGSVISPDGLILTNAHVVLPDQGYPVDALLVSLTKSQDKPPEPAFYAEVIQADRALDLAVIHPSTDLNGQSVNVAALNLPTVAIGDSDQLKLGDSLSILGYPGIGGQTITLTQGVVSGFTSEGGIGDRAFVKTSATISGGNSGGLASNIQGQLIGVPTQLGYGGEDQYVDCRVLADTNGDGVVDNRDSCIPTGGFINALRPIKLAIPLIEAAQRGEVKVVDSTPGLSQVPSPAGGQVLFQDDFSTSLNRWSNWTDRDGSVGPKDGFYQISVHSEKIYVWGRPGQSFKDTVINSQVTVLTPTGRGDFGLICRFREDLNFSDFYAFEISEDGYYAIWKNEKGKVVPLKDWSSSEFLKGLTSPFNIQAACIGNQLTLGVNGTTLAQVTDDSFSSGDVGLLAGTLEKGDLVIGFDNFVVQSPGG